MFLRKVAVAVLTLVMVFSYTAAAMALEADSDKVHRGIDVSLYQGNIDFKKVKADGIDMVYIRASAGESYEDPKFRQNAARARAAGLEYGFYHYVTAHTTAEAKEQARFFTKCIKEYKYTMRPAMDFENFRGLKRETVNQIGRVFMEELEKETGVKPVLYANTNAANHTWEKDFGKYPLWVAQYGPSKPTTSNQIWKAWSGWQYTSSGRVDGISARVDMNRFTKTLLVENTGSEPDSTPDSKPDPDGEKTYIKYKVKKGDTLWSISQKYGTTVNTIVKLNKIQNPDLIYAGEVFRIPRDKEQAGKPADWSYMVKRGDTLWEIAMKYKTTVDVLVKKNRIADRDLILPGWVIQMPR